MRKIGLGQTGALVVREQNRDVPAPLLGELLPMIFPCAADCCTPK